MSLRISITTPSFNQGQYIDDAILSVVRQNYGDFEHIVTDASSTDNTVELLKKYRHLRWVSERDGGQSDAINKGFRMSQGDLVGWLNADDFYLPGALEIVGQFAAEHPEVDVIYGECAFVDTKGSLLRVKRDHGFDAKVLFYHGCYIPSTATFFRRRILDQGFYLDCNYRYCMDFEYFVRLSRAGKKFAYIPKLLAAFRWHDSNASLDASGRSREAQRTREMFGNGWNATKRPSQIRTRVYRAKRVALKLVNGGYLAELRAQKFRGHSTLWFRTPEAYTTCTSLQF